MVENLPVGLLVLRIARRCEVSDAMSAKDLSLIGKLKSIWFYHNLKSILD